MKIQGIVFRENSALLNSVIEEARQSLNITEEKITEILKSEKGQKIFESHDKTIASLLADKFTKEVFEDNYQISKNNERKIIDSGGDLFHWFYAYVHSVHIVYENVLTYLQEESIVDKLEIKDIVNITIYGNLCRIADQVGLLLRNGFPEAALTFWRSFYEYAAVVCFLIKNDSNELAQRFVDSSHKTLVKKLESMEKHHAELKFSPAEPELSAKVLAHQKDLKEKYPKEFFNSDYGWASGFVDGNPNFRVIEEASGFSRFRPFYLWATERSHPNYYGLTSFRNDDLKLDFRNIVRQRMDKSSMIDPAQLTLAVFDQVNMDFFDLYSVDYEFDTNKSIFRELYRRFAETL